MEKIKSKKQAGITLVALVVTIVVLIILATISINIIFGEEGILTRARQAKEHMANAEVEEQQIIAEAANTMEEHIVGEREQVTVDRDEYENLKKAVAELQQKEPIVIEREFGGASITMPAGTWTTLETFSFSDYGTGKATISYTASNKETSTKNFCIQMLGNEKIIGFDESNENSYSTIWRRCSTSATIEYDENTSINFMCISEVSHIPYYTYSILILPD